MIFFISGVLFFCGWLERDDGVDDDDDVDEDGV